MNASFRGRLVFVWGGRAPTPKEELICWRRHFWEKETNDAGALTPNTELISWVTCFWGERTLRGRPLGDTVLLRSKMHTKHIYVC